MKKLFFAACILGVLFINCAKKQNESTEIPGELLIDEKAGFSINIPNGWTIEERDDPEIYLCIAGPRENEITSNFNFYTYPNSDPLDTVIDRYIESNSENYPGYSVIKREKFTTNAGFDGIYIKWLGPWPNGTEVMQKMYYLPNEEETQIMQIIFIGYEKYETIVDECVKTFIRAE